MNSNLATDPYASEGNDDSNRFQGERDLETAGNYAEYSLSLRYLNEAIDASRVQRKVLAAECHMKDAQFSKSLNGQPGGDFTTVLDRIRPSIRGDYARRLAASVMEGGLQEMAAEKLMQAATEYLMTCLITRVPTRTVGRR